MAIDDHAVFRAGCFWVEELDGRFLVRERMRSGARDIGFTKSRERAELHCRDFAEKFPHGTKNQFAPKTTATAAA